VAGTIRCGRCGRPILAGDAYQCTSCNTCHHGSCWISTPSCTCGCASNNVVHISSNGEIKQSGGGSRQVPGRQSPNQQSVDNNGVLRIDDSPDPVARHLQRQAALQKSSTMGSQDVELECSHCLLPVDTLSKPCPFCGHMPSGKSLIIRDNQMATYDNAPWGIRAISAINQASGVMSWFITGGTLVSFLAYGDPGALFASIFFGLSGYFNWRLGADLLKKKKWARTVLTIFATISLFGFPLFTLWGAMVLWGLHSSKAEEYFEEPRLLTDRSGDESR